MLTVALVAGLIVRAVPILGSSFPLHDGGLFHVMAQDLLRADFVLPFVTTYNEASIPFAYPPLGLYVLAAGSTVADPLFLMRVLPVLYATLSIAAVYAVASALMPRTVAAVAALIFAVMPHAYDWLIIGGGVTRGLGFLLALAFIAVSLRVLRRPRAAGIATGGILAGMTILAHPEATAFAVVSLAALGLLEERSARRGATIFLLLAVGLLVAGPWIYLIVSRHGWEIFTGAAASRDAFLIAVQRLFEMRITGSPFPLLDVPLWLGVIGLVALAARGRWTLPVWTGAVLLAAAGAYYITVPWAVLAAHGIHVVLTSVRSERTRRIGIAVAAGVSLSGALFIPFDSATPVRAIGVSDRAVMSRIPHGGSPVAVITNRTWWLEGPGEWFPAVSGRQSAAVAQGSEWLPGSAWIEAKGRHEDLQSCGRSVACVVDWMNTVGADTLFISEASGMPLSDPIESGRFVLITSDGRAGLFRLLPGNGE